MSNTGQFLQQLIALPSVNPAFLPPDDPRGGEKRVCDFLRTTARSAGLDVELQNVSPERSNLLARLKPRGRSRCTIILAPHMDTVDASAEQFQPREEKGRIFGRGACDTK